MRRNCDTHNANSQWFSSSNFHSKLKCKISRLQYNKYLLCARNLSCDDELPWKEGSTLYNYLAGVSFRGLTGPIQFKEGRRVDLKLDLLKLKAEKMQKVNRG